MTNLYDYIMDMQGSTINEGFLLNAATKSIVNKMSPKDLMLGVLNLYDYIVDEDDIKLFLQDFPLKEQLFWKNLYNLYNNKVWSIIDADPSDIAKLNIDYHKLIEVNVEFRRELRYLIKQSRNSKLDLKPSEPSKVMIIKDGLNNKSYILTINRTTGLLKRMFRSIDAKFLTFIFEKLASNINESLTDHHSQIHKSSINTYGHNIFIFNYIFHNVKISKFEYEDILNMMLIDRYVSSHKLQKIDHVGLNESKTSVTSLIQLLGNINLFNEIKKLKLTHVSLLNQLFLSDVLIKILSKTLKPFYIHKSTPSIDIKILKSNTLIIKISKKNKDSGIEFIYDIDESKLKQLEQLLNESINLDS